jgi:hypothetical protein
MFFSVKVLKCETRTASPRGYLPPLGDAARVEYVLAGALGKSQLRRQGSKAKDQHGRGLDNPLEASKTILYLSKTKCAIFLTRII